MCILFRSRYIIYVSKRRSRRESSFTRQDCVKNCKLLGGILFQSTYYSSSLRPGGELPFQRVPSLATAVKLVGIKNNINNSLYLVRTMLHK